MMTPSESLTEAIENLSQKKHVISKKALKAKYELENNMGATVAEKEGEIEVEANINSDLDKLNKTESDKKEPKKGNRKTKKKDNSISQEVNQDPEESIVEKKISGESFSDRQSSESQDEIELERDVKINNYSSQSVVVDKKELLLREFNKNIHLLIAVFQRSKFDEVTWFLSRPGRMLFLNFFIGVIRGTGFILGVLTILAILGSMATSSSETMTFFLQQFNSFSRLMF